MLTSLHEDIGQVIKTEIREVLVKEMAGLRSDINTVKTKLQSYQKSVANELTALRNYCLRWRRACPHAQMMLQRYSMKLSISRNKRKYYKINVRT